MSVDLRGDVAGAIGLVGVRLGRPLGRRAGRRIGRGGRPGGRDGNRSRRHLHLLLPVRSY